jgi:TBC1 domain family member 15
LAVEVDDLLAIRVVHSAKPAPRAILYARGGRRVAVLVFGDAGDGLSGFVDALKAHVYMTLVDDHLVMGDLFVLESRSRIRRVAPGLDNDGDRSDDDRDGVGSEQWTDEGAPRDIKTNDSDIGAAPDDDERAASSDPSARREDSTASAAEPLLPRRWRRNQDPSALKPAPGRLVLEQFARVTQLARDVGDDIARIFNEKRRTEEAERIERERRARERALDLYADISFADDYELDVESETAGGGVDAYGANRIRPPRMVLKQPRGVPLSLETWDAAFSEDGSGSLADPALMRLAIFAGGIHKDLRPRAWPFVLGLFPWNSTEEQRHAIIESNTDRYALLRSTMLDMKAEARATEAESLVAAMENLGRTHAAHGTGRASGLPAVPERRQRISKGTVTLLEIEEQIAKDIVRTDRLVDVYKEDNSRLLGMMGDILNTYGLYNRAIGYCQGMSDFVSPLLFVFGEQEEVLTFWCFVALMERVELNFRVDQSGINAQLGAVRKLLERADPDLYDYFAETDPDFYCVFRWILVWFKREFPFEQIARLWEVMWSRQLAGDKLQIHMAVGMLRAHRKNLLSLDRGQFDKLLRYVNDMSMHMDVDFALKQGELCYQAYGDLP